VTLRSAVHATRSTCDAASTYDTLVRRADTLRRTGEYTAALRAFQAIAAQYPDRSDALSNLAGMLQASGHPLPALQASSRALELDPANLSALINSAEILKEFGDWQTVTDTYDAALALCPASAEIRFARGLHLLMLGHWAEGWREHEQRQLLPDLPLRRTPLLSPRWDGAPLAGRRILLDHEQGLGDQIMFARFATDVAARGGEVTLRCSATLAPLFEAMRGVNTVNLEGSPVPQHDVHASLMSLPALLGLSSPADVSGAAYLTAVGECPPHLRSAFPPRRGARVGLVWSGNPQHRNDARRSVPVALLSPLLTVPDIQLIALQKHEGDVTLPDILQGRVADLGPILASFNDTAHALLQLDLLVTVDTAVAHLAGALGVPTLILVPFVPDWRWMLDRADTPWYQSVQLVRQSTLFEWSPVIATVRERLTALRRREQ
jgi:Tfp pilus assembly protein PilF